MSLETSPKPAPKKVYSRRQWSATGSSNESCFETLKIPTLRANNSHHNGQPWTTYCALDALDCIDFSDVLFSLCISNVVECYWCMICIKHQGDVQGKHCFFLPEPNSRRWNNDLLQVGKIRISSLTISFNVSVLLSEVDVQTLSSEHREHCHALKISQGHESQQLISLQSSNVLSHSYKLFCHDSSPGVEFVGFLWPP